MIRKRLLNTGLLCSRRDILGVACGCLGLFLLSCGQQTPGGPTTSASSSQSTLEFAALPAGLGRGYPLAKEAEGSPSDSVEAGDVAPNFQIELEDGAFLTLHDLSGRPIMLNFWATWCGPCRIEMPEIVAEHNRNDDLIILAINTREDLELVQDFAYQFNMTMPVIRDRDGYVQDLYQVRAMPTSIFIDRDGVIAARFAGIVTAERLQEFLRLIS